MNDLEMIAMSATASRALEGRIYRAVTVAYANTVDLLSGQGSRLHGQRWNPRGIAAVYGTFGSPELALKEALVKSRSGIGIEAAFMPRVVVAIDISVGRAIDLTLPATLRKLEVTRAELLAEDWYEIQRLGRESMTQALGRQAFECGIEALIVPSARSARGKNLVVFPANLAAASTLVVQHAEQLPDG